MGVQPTEHFSTNLQVCYEVKLYLAYLLQKLAPGEILEFTSSDPNSPAEILPWLELREYELVEIQHIEDNLIRFFIRRPS
jgi:TusA-related sulfurtransferase